MFGCSSKSFRMYSCSSLVCAFGCGVCGRLDLFCKLSRVPSYRFFQRYSVCSVHFTFLATQRTSSWSPSHILRARSFSRMVNLTPLLIFRSSSRVKCLSVIAHFSADFKRLSKVLNACRLVLGKTEKKIFQKKKTDRLTDILPL